MSMETYIIVAENERQQTFYQEQRHAKRMPTTEQDETMQLKWNIYKRLKREEFDDEPNDDYVASDQTYLKNMKGVVETEDKPVKQPSSFPWRRGRKRMPYRIKPRSPPNSFYRLMCRLSDDQKAAIREMGFASMLDFQIDKIPTVMGYWAVKNFDHKACTLKIRDASLKVTNKTIHDVLGVPMGGTRINTFITNCKWNLATQEFRKQFPATKKSIRVADVIREMVEQEKGGTLFKLNFLVLFVTVMVGSHGGVVNQNFLGCMKNLQDVRNMDWCQYILECLVRTRREWNPISYFNGPMAFLVVFYAHSINPKNTGKETLVPVINLWTSDMLMELEAAEFNTGGIENDVVGSGDGELNRDDTQNMAEELGTPHLELCEEKLYNKYDDLVLSIGGPKQPTTKELRQQLPAKASTSQCSVICVQGYEVKESVAPILEAIFKKHGDIAAECIYTIASVKASFLEAVCEVVRRIQANDVTEKMEEIEALVSQAQAAKIDVSWLWVHLEAIYKRKEVMKKWSLLMETKVNTGLVQIAAQMDLRERCAELVTAQERFEEAERCIRVLHLVEKKLNNEILDSKRLVGKTTSFIG
uniref:uncharacterized protein LOC122607801 n=1 Tax=Erigeron canadensis TaxID=72917 RepID=UPI001CB9413E|nr:uncharacterized protein LOC122607801 [Erigeron canadensis]